jgi:hypothetical protein
MPSDRPYYDRRVNTDRRLSSNAEQSELAYVLEKLEQLSSHTTQTNNDAAIHASSQLTFTLPQMATGLFALLTVIGGAFGTWSTLNSQMTSQKVSTDLTIEQLHKDIAILEKSDKDAHAKLDTTITQFQASIKDLNTRDNELDSTVTQLFNSRSNLRK